MKKLTTIMLSGLCATLLADGDPQAIIEKQAEQIEKLQQMVEELNSRMGELEEVAQGGVSAEMEEELGFIDERLSMVEESAFMDKIRLGLGFKTRFDNFDNKMASGNSYSDNANWSQKVHINMDARIDDDMKFSGRATAYKYWGDSTRRDAEMADMVQARYPSDSGLYLERAYIDWRLSDGEIPVVLSIGRLPGSDGPSYQFMEGTPRVSNYSGSLIDLAIDGIILTADVSEATDIPEAAVRAVYGKPYQEDDADTSSSSFTGVTTDTHMDDYHTYGIVTEMAIPGIEGSLASANFLWGADAVANPLQGIEAGNVNVGDFNMIGAFVELPNVVEGLDLFAHANFTTRSPHAVVYDSDPDTLSPVVGLGKGNVLTQVEYLAAAQMYAAQAEALMAAGDTSGATTAAAQAQGASDALAAYQEEVRQDTDDVSGHNFWVGMRYQIPAWINPYLGLEWNYGSKHWWSGTSAASHVTNKIATRGHAYEAYFLAPINQYANLRLGYIYQDFEYTSGFLGESVKVSDIKNSAAAQASGYADTVQESLSTIYAQLNIFF